MTKKEKQRKRGLKGSTGAPPTLPETAQKKILLPELLLEIVKQLRRKKSDFEHPRKEKDKEKKTKQ